MPGCLACQPDWRTVRCLRAPPPPVLSGCHRCLAGLAELKSHLQARRSAPYWARIADFHLLLFLARQPNLSEAEIGLLADAARDKAAVPEGFQIIIDSMAGL
jgi:hypothetical protein